MAPGEAGISTVGSLWKRLLTDGRFKATIAKTPVAGPVENSGK
jgi:hypothetical protein